VFTDIINRELASSVSNVMLVTLNVWKLLSYMLNKDDYI